MRFIFSVFVTLCFIQPLFADSISIAVPELHVRRSLLQDIFVASGRSPYFEILRSGVVPPAVALAPHLSTSSRGEPALLFVQSIQFAPQPGSDRWTCSVSPRRGITFQNGKELTIRDLKSSFQRCGERVSNTSKSEKGAVLHETLRVEEGEGGLVLLSGHRMAIEELLSSCPIMQEDSAESFGDRLGTVNFMVGLGAYEIQTIKPGIRVTLSKVKEGWLNREQYPKLTPFPPSIEVQAISEARRALTALRYGSIDLMFLEGPHTGDLGAGDETIHSGKCRGFHVLYRRGLRVECDDPRWVAMLRYES